MEKNMKNIKVLGSGCSNFRATSERIEQRANELQVEVELEKVEEIQDIMRYNVMSTPGVVVDGVVVHAGGVPKPAQIDQWLC